MPVTRYARSGGVNIAYQVLGEGPRDLVYVPGFVSNLEVVWEDPATSRVLERLASFSRLILFDKRGTGMSDSVAPDRMPTLEERMDDVRAVMDAAGSEKATLFGHSEGGNMCILFAASRPERTEALILLSSYAKRLWSEDYPWAPRVEDREAHIEETERTWGDPDHIPSGMAPTRIHDEAFRNWLARYFRLSASPQGAVSLLRMNTEIDTRAVLPTIGVPTLCLYRTHDIDVLLDEGRWIAGQIPNARFVELPGSDHWLAGDDPDALVAVVEEFVTGNPVTTAPERVLATILFTDIVSSTEQAAAMGDARWRDLLERHRRLIRVELSRHRGEEVDTAGDGFLALFDGPARAIRAAQTIVRSSEQLGLRVRAGVHTGEVERTDGDVVGVAVHIGARVSALAGPGEVIVSRTVRDLVAGSGIEFDDRGVHGLKGISEPWQVYAAV